MAASPLRFIADDLSYAVRCEQRAERLAIDATRFQHLPRPLASPGAVPEGYGLA